MFYKHTKPFSGSPFSLSLRDTYLTLLTLFRYHQRRSSNKCEYQSQGSCSSSRHLHPSSRIGWDDSENKTNLQHNQNKINVEHVRTKRRQLQYKFTVHKKLHKGRIIYKKNYVYTDKFTTDIKEEIRKLKEKAEKN